MTMMKGYDPDSERKYAAPEAPRIVEPEPMTPKIPNWVKYSILYLAGTYLFFNSIGFLLAGKYRLEDGMSKSEIEEKIDKDYGDQSGLVQFVLDDLSKPGRELAYLIRGDGEQEK